MPDRIKHPLKHRLVQWQDRSGLIKVCGLTDPLDTRVALEAGVDLVGLIFSRSPRRVKSDAVKDWVKQLQTEFPQAGWVGVFLPEDLKLIPGVLEDLKIDLIQFHGIPVPLEVYQYGYPVMPCLRIREARPIPPDEEPDSWALLLDTYDPDREGGTGKTFPWDWVKGWSRHRRILLSGGLGPDNVAEAVRSIHPHGVDASSRLESAKGRKDHTALRSYILNARAAFNELEESSPEK